MNLIISILLTPPSISNDRFHSVTVSERKLEVAHHERQDCLNNWLQQSFIARPRQEPIIQPTNTLPYAFVKKIEGCCWRTSSWSGHTKIKIIQNFTLNLQSTLHIIFHPVIAMQTKENRGLIKIYLLARTITVNLECIFESLYTPYVTSSKEDAVICKQ
jgi:hypothetical protein